MKIWFKITPYEIYYLSPLCLTTKHTQSTIVYYKLVNVCRSSLGYTHCIFIGEDKFACDVKKCFSNYQNESVVGKMLS